MVLVGLGSRGFISQAPWKPCCVDLTVFHYLLHRCEKVAEECLENPCLNSGRCVNSDGSIHCICTGDFQGTFCTQRIVTPTAGPSSWILGSDKIALISAGVLGLIILLATFLLIHKGYCRRAKAHKPVAKEDPDLISKSEFSKSVGVGTQGLPPIELNILRNGHHSHRNSNALDPGKPTVSPELVTFNPSHVQKQRGVIVCSVAPNLPTAAPSSNPNNESITKSTWAGEKMGLFDLLSLSLLYAILGSFQTMVFLCSKCTSLPSICCGRFRNLSSK